MDSALEVVRRQIADKERLRQLAVEHGLMERARQLDAAVDALEDVRRELEEGLH